MKKCLSLLLVFAFMLAWAPVSFAAIETIDASQTYNTNGDPDMDGAIFNGDFTYTVADNEDLGKTGTVSIDSNGTLQGTVTFTGGSDLTGSIGQTGAGENIKVVNANGADGQTVTIAEDSYVETFNIGAGQVTLAKNLSVTSLVFGSAASTTGSITIADTKTLTGAVSVTDTGGEGLINFAGGGVMAGNIGTSTNLLNKLTIDSGNNDGKTVSTNGDIFATTVLFTGNSTLTMTADKTLTATIDSGTDFEGNLTLQGTTVATGVIGGTKDLDTITAGSNGKTVTFASAVNADTIAFGGTGTINLQGATTAATALDFAANDSILNVSGATLAAPVTVTGDVGTVSFLGNTAVTGVFGSDATNRVKVLNGGYTTFNDTFANNVFAKTINAGSNGTLTTGTGTLTFGGDVNTGAAGVLNFGGNSTVIVTNGTLTAPTISVTTAGQGTLTVKQGTITSTGGIGTGTAIGTVNLGETGTTTVGAAINATNVNITGANTVNFNGNVAASSGASFTADGIAVIADAPTGTITGNITNGVGVNNKGEVDFLGDFLLVTGNLGATGATGALKSVIIDSNNSDTGETVNVNGNIFAQTVNFAGDGGLTLSSGKSITGSVTSTTDNEGTLIYSGGVAGTGGTIGNLGTNTGLKEVRVAGGTFAWDDNIRATGININGTSNVTLGGAISAEGGLAQAAAANTLDLGDNTLTLTGTYGLGAGARLALTIQDATTFGKIVGSGVATTSATALYDVTVLNPIANGTTYQVITGANGGVTLPTTAITTNSAFLNLVASEPTDGDLVLTAVANTSEVATTANAEGVFTAIDGAIADGSASQDFLDDINVLYSITDPAEAEAALNTLDPVDNGGAQGASFAAMGSALGTVTSHMDSVRTGISTGETGFSAGGVDPKSNAIWIKGFGNFVDQDNRKGVNGYEADIWGTVIGIDGPVNGNCRVGLSGGYSNSDVDAKGTDANTNVDGYSGTLYGTHDGGNYYLDGAFTIGWNNFDSDRRITFGSIDRVASADYDGMQYSLYGGAGWPMMSQGWKITPMASLQWMHLDIDSYTEDGAGALNLNVDDQSYDVLQSSLGVKFAYPVVDENGTFTPEVHAKWLYDFVGDNAQTSSSFTGGGSSFTTNGLDPAQNSFNIGAGLTFASINDVTIEGTYDFEVKSDYSAHTGVLTLKYNF